jgi:Tfp pilus assembly protein PilF
LLYEKEDRNKEALQYLDHIEGQIGTSREISVTKSRIYDRMGNGKMALGQLRKTLTGEEGDYIILGVIAEFYRTHGEVDSAEFYYRKIINEHADDPSVMFSYGEFLLEQKQMKEAKSVYVQIFGNDKIDENILFGYLYSTIQDVKLFGLVRPVLDTVVESLYGKKPANMRVMSLYSDIKYRLGKFQEAAGVLKKIIIQDTDNYAAFEQLLFCEDAENQHDSVIYYADIAIKKFVERPLPYLILSSVYYKDENYERAIELLKTGENYAREDKLKIEFYSLLAECFGKTEKFDLSDDYYNRALMMDSLNSVILNNYAYNLAIRTVNLEKAEHMSRYTIRMEPLNSTYLDTYGWIMYMENNMHEALKYIRKAIKYGGSTNGEILSHYGDILMKKGRGSMAIQIWTEALKYADEDMMRQLKDKIRSGFNK